MASRGEAPVTAVIEGWAMDFLAAPRRYATLATVDPDGAPLQAVIWYALLDGGVLFNSRVGRRWPTNLLRDPRASLVVHDGLDYVGVRGLVEPLYEGERALEDICALARAYHLTPEKVEESIRDFRSQARISFLLRPTSVMVHR